MIVKWSDEYGGFYQGERVKLKMVLVSSFQVVFKSSNK